ncbi:unnamed protein product [Sympodiomycopsis kandeliae]
MSQPATAGAIVAGIFAGLAILYFGYRGYVKWHRHRRAPVDSELPPIRELQTSYIASGPPGSSVPGTINSTQRPWPTSMSSAGTLYGDYGNSSKMQGSSSRASIGAGSIFRQSLGPEMMNKSRPESTILPLSQPADNSVPASPTSQATDFGALPLPPPSATTLNETGPHHSRMSSASSTMTLKRTYAGSAYRGSVGSSGFVSSPTFEKQQRRDSWLPHSPLNRDAIQIVPPQPLGVGFGSMATAMDERTLAFSKTSGIGAGDEVFGQGMAWGNSGSNQNGPTPSESHSWNNMSEDQRHRYLQQGPSPGLAVNTSSSSLGKASGSGQSDPNGEPSVRIPQSRSGLSNGASNGVSNGTPVLGASRPPSSFASRNHSPQPDAVAARSRATSGVNSAEGVEATLGELPSQSSFQNREALSHLKAVSSSDAYANPAAFTSQTSPLQALSQQGQMSVTSYALPKATPSPPPKEPSSSGPTSQNEPAPSDVHSYNSSASGYLPASQRLNTPGAASGSEGDTSTSNQSPILAPFGASDSTAALTK